MCPLHCLAQKGMVHRISTIRYYQPVSIDTCAGSPDPIPGGIPDIPPIPPMPPMPPMAAYGLAPPLAPIHADTQCYVA